MLSFWSLSLTAFSVSGLLLLTAAFAGALLTGYLKAAVKFITLEELLYRLDEEHSLRGKLIAAVDGKSEYPDFCQTHYSLSSTPLSTPGSMALALLMVILLIPPAELEAYSPLSPPLEWSTIESTLTELKANTPLSDPQLSALEQEFQELASLPKQKWYSPESLEATDTLVEKIDQYSRKAGNAEQSGGNSDAQLDKGLASDSQTSMYSNQIVEQISPESMRTDKVSGLPSATTVELEDLQSPSQGEQKESCTGKGNHGNCESSPSSTPQGGTGGENGSGLNHQENNQGKGGDISRGPGTSPIEFGARSRVLGGERQYITSPEINRKTKQTHLGVGFSSRSSVSSDSSNPIGKVAPSSGQRGLVVGNYLSPSEQSAVKRFYSTR
jgi:hypothetical protein